MWWRYLVNIVNVDMLPMNVWLNDGSFVMVLSRGIAVTSSIMTSSMMTVSYRFALFYSSPQSSSTRPVDENWWSGLVISAMSVTSSIRMTTGLITVRASSHDVAIMESMKLRSTTFAPVELWHLGVMHHGGKGGEIMSPIILCCC